MIYFSTLKKLKINMKETKEVNLSFKKNSFNILTYVTC